jgi:ABC-type sugar transport system ATPase subunit
VAAFIGAPAMNLFPAPLAGGPAAQVWGVRPEQCRLQAADGAGLPVTVTAVEYLGAECLVQCAVHAAPPRLVVRVAPHEAPSRGIAATLAWDAQALHAFDARTGLRLS